MGVLNVKSEGLRCVSSSAGDMNIHCWVGGMTAVVSHLAGLISTVGALAGIVIQAGVMLSALVGLASQAANAAPLGLSIGLTSTKLGLPFAASTANVTPPVVPQAA